jgi:hypothetical protein
MEGAALAVLAAVVAAATGTGAVHSARQAETIAARHVSPYTPESDPKKWHATFDGKSRKWTACVEEPKSSPQSGFCLFIDAKTGKVAGIDIMN